MSIDQQYPTPMTIHVPPPPPLVPDEPLSSSGGPGVADERTNTLALLLPHTSLFSPPILELLRAHYEQYGPIAHWAPVKAFGRVIVVFAQEEDAERAKVEGDRLWLDVDMHLDERADGASKEGEGYFKGHRRRASQPHPKGG